MSGVLTGFAVIATVIGVGYLMGRYGLLGENGREVLTKLAFHIASPALLFETLAGTDLSLLVSAPLVITALCTVAMAGVYTLIGALRRWPAGEITVGALCASYVNAGNLGIPVAAYVLGDASLVAPVLLFQLLLVTPVALTVLDITTSGPGDSVLRRVTSPFRNSIVIGSLAGVVVAATGNRLPEPVMEPFHLIGAMSVPAVLLAFGISLHGSALPGRGSERVPVLLSVALKTVGQPATAWLLGATVFGLGGRQLFTVVVTAALPAAQNLFTYASRYGVGVRVARESILLSTILAIPALVAVAALLG
ncbi:AEC family transporter [Streptomyces iconiensis]|uniref:AEC family transporter n=1 Tax=Streptomyces iconiensis TaxID=1384038 RepID=A0ABT7A1I1_9ACTN|nr:AEC family transporter [Streptomyces iconiensis]MDJ1135197.1 AEC family transporter [Streptomyces iconiensis]